MYNMLQSFASSSRASSYFSQKVNERKQQDSTRQYLCRCYSDGEVIVEHTSSGESRVISKLQIPSNSCGFVTSKDESIILLILCTGVHIFVYREPFSSSSLEFSLPCSSSVVSVSGIIDPREEHTAFLFFGHYNGHISCCRMDIATFKYEILETLTSSSNLNDMNIEGNSQTGSSSQGSLGAILTIQPITFPKHTVLVGDTSIFSSPNDASNDNLLLVVLYSSCVVKVYDCSFYRCSVTLQEKYRNQVVENATSLTVVALDRYLNFSHLTSSTLPCYAFIVPGSECIQLILLNSQGVTSSFTCIPPTIGRNTLSCRFTSAVAVGHKTGNNCDMIVFCGDREGKLYRARIPQHLLTCGSLTISQLSLKQIEGKKLKGIVMGISFFQSQSNRKRISFYDRLNYCLEM